MLLNAVCDRDSHGLKVQARKGTSSVDLDKRPSIQSKTPGSNEFTVIISPDYLDEAWCTCHR